MPRISVRHRFDPVSGETRLAFDICRRCDNTCIRRRLTAKVPNLEALRRSVQLLEVVQ
jgi:hypothetical protein